MMIYKVLSFLYLSINSLSDIRYKKISLFVSVLFGIAAILVNIIIRQYSLLSLILAVVLGGIIMLVSKITKGAIGIGDGIVLMVLGLYTGIYINLTVLFYGFLVSALMSILLLSLKRVRKKDSLPFVPCLLVGYLITLVLEEWR